MNKSYTTDIIIVGAGLAGLTLACLLEKQSSYRVIIVERDAQPRQRVSAVNSLSVKLWQHLGIWNADILQASSFRHIHIWDHGGASFDFDASYLSDEPLGYIVQDQRLHESLLAQLKNSAQVRLLMQQQCLDIVSCDDYVCLQTEEATLHGQYLIACDGAHSWVREHMQMAMTLWSYQHVAITAQINTEKSHQHSAWQKFTDEGPLAFLPLLDSHQSSLVWSVPLKRAETLLALNDEKFIKELNFAFDATLGNISHVGQRFSFPLIMRHTKEYIKHRVILCADAAHTIHPMAGQGLNLAMQDVLALVDAFIALQNNKNSRQALRYYERSRQAENWQMILALEAIKRLYEIKVPELKFLMAEGVKYLDKIHPLKSFLAKIAKASHLSPTWLS